MNSKIARKMFVNTISQLIEKMIAWCPSQNVELLRIQECFETQKTVDQKEIFNAWKKFIVEPLNYASVINARNDNIKYFLDTNFDDVVNSMVASEGGDDTIITFVVNLIHSIQSCGRTLTLQQQNELLQMFKELDMFTVCIDPTIATAINAAMASTTA